MSEHPMRAVIYARYSSHNQRDVSIDDQVKACTEYIDKEGYELVGIYKDAAQSGRTSTRADFKRLIADAKKDVYDIVVLWHTDRINRSVINSLITLAKLFEHDRDFRSVCQRELNENGPLRLVFFMLYAWKDELTSLDIGVNVARGLNSNAEKCHPNGVALFGWDIVGAHIDGQGKYRPGDRYEVNEREAEAVRIMFRLRRACWTFSQIAMRLNELGHTTKYGNPITSHYVQKIICDPRYMGVYWYGHVCVEGGMPAIVTEKEWRAAQTDAVLRRSEQHKKHRKPHRKHIRVEPGMVFGDLEVTELSRITKNRNYVWQCKCHACGGTTVEWAQRLTSGKATHCGCKSTGQPHGANGKFVSRRE